MSRPICLVTGATGALGPAVVAALARTHHVRTLSRRPPPAQLFGDTVTPFTGDTADRAAVTRAAEGVSAIVHLAALLHIVDPPPALRPEYERVNVEGTRVVLEAATAAGVSRVVFASTIAVYGPQAGALVDEDTTPQPDTFYGETKLAAERIALDARTAAGAPLAVVLRAAAVYGPRVKGNYRTLVDAIARRRFVPIGPGANRRTLVFEDDLADAIALAVAHPAAAGGIYNVSDGSLHPMREIIHAIARALGRTPPRWHVPVAPVRAVVGVAGLFDRRFPRLLDKYLEDVAVDARRIQNELGFRPQYDLGGGWRTTVERMVAATGA